jgi:hypothetical protein
MLLQEHQGYLRPQGHPSVAVLVAQYQKNPPLQGIEELAKTALAPFPPVYFPRGHDRR